MIPIKKSQPNNKGGLFACNPDGTGSAFIFNLNQKTFLKVALCPTAYLSGEVPGLCSYNGNIYIVGGGGSGNAVRTTVNIYSIANNSWSTGTVMTTGVNNFAITALNSKIYVIGGDTGTGGANATTTVQVYDINANSWSTGTALASADESFSACTYNGLIYILSSGGTMFSYDGTTYTTLAAPPAGLTNGGLQGTMSVMNGFIYAYGSTASVIVQYNPRSNTWTTPKASPTTLLNCGGGTLDNRIYAIYCNQTTVVQRFAADIQLWETIVVFPTNAGGRAYNQTCSFNYVDIF